MPIFGYILTLVAAYLLGSIPTGFLVGKARGMDIRTIGSGNIGATNVFRYFGTAAGAFVLAMDAVKGWVAVALLTRLFAGWWQVPMASSEGEGLKILAGLGAVLGHNYTCWLRFKGGKGIATSAGVLLALVPGALLIILGVWIVVFSLSRYVSLASIAASITLPFATWITGQSWTLVGVTSGMTVLAVYKHRSNIQRLLNGTESRMGAKKAATISSTTKPTT